MPGFAVGSDAETSTRGLQSGDVAVACLAFVVWLSARYPMRGAVVVGAFVASLALVAGRILGWRLLGFGLLAISIVSILSVRSLNGQHLGVGGFAGQITLLTDPKWRGPVLNAEARLAGKHVSVSASGAPAWRLARAEAGNRLTVSGRVSALRAPIPTFMVARHLAASLSVQKVVGIDHGSRMARFANSIRHRMLASGSVLSPQSRVLYGGFLLGDDRDQRPEVTDDFRAAGLTHLLVVSGQNVAFTLAVFSPLLMRLSMRSRFVTVLIILGVFALVTRFEPSVLRAVAMAGLVALSRLLGRPQHSARILSIAVICMLMIDPMLAWSVGFLLSVSACAGLALLVPWFEHVRGPRWLITPLATTLAAQTGASLVMIPVFGSVPVIAPLANMVALPAAAPIMSWGVAAGFPAGFFGPGVARIVHLPTEILLRWIAGVARVGAMIPLGQLDGVSLLWGLFAYCLFLIFRAVWSSKFAGDQNRLGVQVSAPVEGWAQSGALRHGRSIEANPNVDQFSVDQFTDDSFAYDQQLRKAKRTVPLRRGVGAMWFVILASTIPTIQALTTVEPLPVALVKGAEVIGAHSHIGGLARSVDVLLISHGVDAGKLLAGLRKERIRSITTLVILSGGRPQAKVVAALSDRVSIGGLVAGNQSFAGLRLAIVPAPIVTFVSGGRTFVASVAKTGKITLKQIS